VGEDGSAGVLRSPGQTVSACSVREPNVLCGFMLCGFRETLNTVRRGFIALKGQYSIQPIANAHELFSADSIRY
jgi:hypothetical protein